jgi:hypothetical protein
MEEDGHKNIRMKKLTIKEQQIETISKKRYDYFEMDDPDYVEGKTSVLKYQKEIDDLGKQILTYLRIWQSDLTFEFIVEELTKLGWEPNLLYNGDGMFAISGEGIQSIPMCEEQEKGSDWVGHWVQEGGWFDTIREALKYYLNEK